MKKSALEMMAPLKELEPIDWNRGHLVDPHEILGWTGGETLPFEPNKDRGKDNGTQSQRYDAWSDRKQRY